MPAISALVTGTPQINRSITQSAPLSAGLLAQLEPREVASVLEHTPIDDAVALVDSLPSGLKERMLEIVDVYERLNRLQSHLAFDENSAGRIMDAEFVARPAEATVGEVVEQLRELASTIDMISYVYVVDGGGHLVGVTSLRQLLLAEPEQTLGEIMSVDLIKVQTETDQEEVAQLAARYDLLAVPVTDVDNKLVGIVTVDDILDVYREAANEDFFKLAGTSGDELSYPERSFKIARIRLPWLLLNLVGLLLAGMFTLRFEQTFQVALLVGFVPVIMGMAGNIGAQTATITVRGLATGRLGLGPGRMRRFVWQQVKVGAVLAAICTLLVALAVFLMGRGNALMPLVVGVSLFLTVQLASFNGAVIPLLFKKLGIDPAVASGPLVASSNDVLGILVYFSFAWVLLGWLGG
ncbi:MAG: magnesium transporter [Thermoanaerobaculia bacterium]|nr:magnesium transporter [Thermoanaerobaculia bacterium]